MQKVSKEYKESMKQQLRNRSYVKINIGVINQEAQRNAYVTNTKDLEVYSNMDIFEERPGGNRDYASLEHGYTKVDGSVYFLPEDPGLYMSRCTATALLVNEDQAQELRLGFHTAALDIKGITINFGENYPVDFEIIGSHNTVQVTGNELQDYRTEEVFEMTTTIIIRATKMRSLGSRLRIYNVMFGVGLLFDYSKITETNHIMKADQINQDLPSVDFNFRIENMNREFDIENKSSSINFLETGQNIEIEYGYELDDATIEWLKGGTLKLSGWKSNDAEAEFDAVDLLVYMDDTYIKGKYHPEGISLYDLAVEVLDDAGIEPETYSIDNYLKSIKVKNPIPITTHKEALQIIANAGRCTLFINRFGMVSMKSSFMPEYAITSNGEAAYSRLGNIQKDDEKIYYASYEGNSLALDGKHYFLPAGGKYLNIGYVSKQISDGTGIFQTPPVLTINAEASFTTFGLYIRFADHPPEEFDITIYNSVNEIETIQVTDNTEQIYFINHEFSDFNKMVLTFRKLAVHNRLKIDYIKFGETTDYTLSYDDMTKTPTGMQLAKIKELQVIRTNYTKSTQEVNELVSEEVNVSASERVFTATFEEFGYDLASSCEGYQVDIIESGAHYCVVQFRTYPKSKTLLKISVTGKCMGISNSRLTRSINLRGETKVWENPLISEADHAADVLDWLTAYFEADKEYEIDFRGDPCLDANDTLYIENKYNDKLKGRIYHHEIHTSSTLTGKIKARREMDVD